MLDTIVEVCWNLRIQNLPPLLKLIKGSIMIINAATSLISYGHQWQVTYQSIGRSKNEGASYDLNQTVKV